MTSVFERIVVYSSATPRERHVVTLAVQGDGVWRLTRGLPAIDTNACVMLEAAVARFLPLYAACVRRVVASVSVDVGANTSVNDVFASLANDGVASALFVELHWLVDELLRVTADSSVPYANVVGLATLLFRWVVLATACACACAGAGAPVDALHFTDLYLSMSRLMCCATIAHTRHRLPSLG